MPSAYDLEPLLEASELRKYFPVKSALGGKRALLRAVDGVDLEVRRGEILALVGESGCGKSTLGRLLLGLMPPTEGTVRFQDVDLAMLPAREMRELRAKMQIVFQNPYASLNPRMRIVDILAEPLTTHRVADGREAVRNIAADLLEKVGIRPEAMDRFPHEFSGGQRQRIGIARAIALKPELIVCDEPLSALDVSIRSQVINLLCELKRELSLTYVFISHDLSVVRYMSDRVCVMYLGKIVECGDTEDVFGNPLHPYTQSLIEAVPLPDPRRRGRQRTLLCGEIPSPLSPPSGCRFRTRCPIAEPVCGRSEPKLGDAGHAAACHFVGREPA